LNAEVFYDYNSHCSAEGWQQASGIVKPIKKWIVGIGLPAPTTDGTGLWTVDKNTSRLGRDWRQHFLPYCRCRTISIWT
jgi:hypothetical protein